MQPIDLARVKTHPIAARRNLVHLDDLVLPESPPCPVESAGLGAVARHIGFARRVCRLFVWTKGAHAIKSCPSLVLIDLLRR